MVTIPFAGLGRSMSAIDIVLSPGPPPPPRGDEFHDEQLLAFSYKRIKMFGSILQFF